MKKRAICVVVLSKNREKFLTVGRKDMLTDICIPGGMVEEGETWKECGVREIMEETGIDISKETFHFLCSDIDSETGTEVITYYVTSFTGKIYTTELPFVRWVPLSDMCNCQKEEWKHYNEKCYKILTRLLASFLE